MQRWLILIQDWLIDKMLWLVYFLIINIVLNNPLLVFYARIVWKTYMHGKIIWNVHMIIIRKIKIKIILFKIIKRIIKNRLLLYLRYITNLLRVLALRRRRLNSLKLNTFIWIMLSRYFLFIIQVIIIIIHSANFVN